MRIDDAGEEEAAVGRGRACWMLRKDAGDVKEGKGKMHGRSRERERLWC